MSGRRARRQLSSTAVEEVHAVASTAIGGVALSYTWSRGFGKMMQRMPGGDEGTGVCMWAVPRGCQQVNLAELQL